MSGIYWDNMAESVSSAGYALGNIISRGYNMAKNRPAGGSFVKAAETSKFTIEDTYTRHTEGQPKAVKKDK